MSFFLNPAWSLLLNESRCADGYQGQRCENKDIHEFKNAQMWVAESAKDCTFDKFVSFFISI